MGQAVGRLALAEELHQCDFSASPHHNEGPATALTVRGRGRIVGGFDMRNTTLCTAQNRQGKDCMAQVPEAAPLSMCMKHLIIAGMFWEENKDYIRMSMWLNRPEMEAMLGRKQVGHDEDETKVDVVYYIVHGNRIKIGTSGWWQNRIKGLPHDRLLALEPGDINVERIRHREFADVRCGRTEWFETSSDRLWDHIIGINDAHPEFDEDIANHNRKRTNPERSDPVTGPVQYI